MTHEFERSLYTLPTQISTVFVGAGHLHATILALSNLYLQLVAKKEF